jgi:lipopolysaccharide transport system permease protein
MRRLGALSPQKKKIRTIPLMPGLDFLHSIKKNRFLIISMVKRDLKGRYSGSFMGMLWSLLNPLSLFCIYTFVFSIILKGQVGREYGNIPFAIWLLAGMIPWIFFSEAVSQAATTITGNAQLVKKSVFDKDILPLCAVGANFVNHFIYLSLFVIAIVFVGLTPRVSYLWLIPLWLLVFLHALAWSYLLSSLNVYIRDIGQSLGLLLLLAFFSTPIVYPAEMAPAWAQMILRFNPYCHIVHFYREVLLLGKLPDPVLFMMLFLAIAAFFVISKTVFDRLSLGFADAL